MDEKKAFFDRPTPAQIKEGKEPVLLEDKILAGLENLQPHQYAVIPESKFGGDFNPAKFLKHGDTFELRTARPFGKVPRTLFRESVTNRQLSFNTYMSGYSFVPCLGPDRVPRRVPFVELLEAARILAYGHEYPGAAPKVLGEYINSAKVKTEGGSFLVSTPSRSKKDHRYKFTLTGIPIYFWKPHIHLIPYSFASPDLEVKSKMFRELRFTFENSPEPSKINYVQAHAIAAAYTVTELQLKKKNPTPHRFLVFPIVSQQAVNLYTTLLNRTLLQDQKEEKSEQEHLAQAHMEAIMWRLVRREGYEAGFDNKALEEGRVHTYNWKNNV